MVVRARCEKVKKGNSMYYLLTDEGSKTSNQQEYLSHEVGVAVFTLDKWKQAQKLHRELHILLQQEPIHFCKVERHAQFLYGTMCVPTEQPLAHGDTFAFYVVSGHIVIITDHPQVEKQVIRLMEENQECEYSPAHFLYDFLVEFLSDDILKLEELEQVLAQIEEEVLEGRADHFNGRMLQLKKKVFRYRGLPLQAYIWNTIGKDAYEVDSEPTAA